MNARFLALAVCLTVVATVTAAEVTPDSARIALKKASEFFHGRVAVQGGYVYRYSEDLLLSEGEGETDRNTIWVQPPGTPAVGLAFLSAYRATGDKFYLDVARAAAVALVRGQLRSGGWTNGIYFDPELRKKHAYRVDPPHERARNQTTFDDNITQSAIRLLMRVDKALEFKDEQIHEAAAFALENILKAQCGNGAWQQGFAGTPETERSTEKSASYPADWRQLPHEKNYWNHYTLNDNVMQNMITLMFDAARVYDDKKYREAAERAGGFLIRAQLPPPQPGWAQQYNLQMQPAWARKFEPPAVSGGETQGVIRALMMIYCETGDAKYLAPIPAAVGWLRKSQLADGRLARFYELQTNKPLYFTKTYELTFNDDDLPTHYAFKVGNDALGLELEFLGLKDLPLEMLKGVPGPLPMSKKTRQTAQSAVETLDEQGRWLESGTFKYVKQKYDGKVIESQTFIRNVEALSRYLEASKQR